MFDIGPGRKERYFVSSASLQQAQRALEQLFDLRLARKFRRQQFLEIEIRESAPPDNWRQRCPQLFRTNHTRRLNLLKNSSPHWVQKIIRMQEAADFQSRARLDQYRAQQAQSIALRSLAVRHVH